MSLQVLCCVETEATADFDYQYIKETISRFYVDDRKTIIRPIYLGSKTRYKAKSVISEIHKRTKKHSGETAVVYFIDYDDCDNNAETLKLFEKIKKFCIDNGFRFVFFCKDIEDVYIGHPVDTTQKRSAVAKFKSGNMINTINEKALRREDYKRHKSNILNVLDEYFIRRKEN